MVTAMAIAMGMATRRAITTITTTGMTDLVASVTAAQSMSTATTTDMKATATAMATRPTSTVATN